MNAIDMLCRCAERQPDNPRGEGMGYRQILEDNGLLSDETLAPTGPVLEEERGCREVNPLDEVIPPVQLPSL